MGGRRTRRRSRLSAGVSFTALSLARFIHASAGCARAGRITIEMFCSVVYNESRLLSAYTCAFPTGGPPDKRSVPAAHPPCLTGRACESVPIFLEASSQTCSQARERDREPQAIALCPLLSPHRAARAAMALAALSGDAQCIIFSQLCNVLDPHC